LAQPDQARVDEEHTKVNGQDCQRKLDVRGVTL
jgi:hypothetical protein